MATLQTKETETNHKKSEVEKQLEVVEAEKLALKNQLKLAQTRIESLQKALKGEDSEEEEEMTSFMEHHRRAMSVTRARSMTRELSVGRELRSSSMTRDIRASTCQPRDIRASMPRDILTTGRDTRDIKSMSRDIRASVAREFESATRDYLTTRVEENKEPQQSTSVTSPTVAKET